MAIEGPHPTSKQVTSFSKTFGITSLKALCKNSVHVMKIIIAENEYKQGNEIALLTPSNSLCHNICEINLLLLLLKIFMVKLFTEKELLKFEEKKQLSSFFFLIPTSWL